MAETPSKRRRKGREAFELGVDPRGRRTNRFDSWDYKMNLQDWLNGWEEARLAHEQEEKEQADHIKEIKAHHEQYHSTCPKCGQLFATHNDDGSCVED